MIHGAPCEGWTINNRKSRVSLRKNLIKLVILVLLTGLTIFLPPSTSQPGSTRVSGAAQSKSAPIQQLSASPPATIPDPASSSEPWTNLNLTTPNPPARHYHSMVYDAADNSVILFGGAINGATDQTNETWQFKAGSWTQLSPSIAPPGRDWPSMAYDEADGYVLLFGGNGAGCAAAFGTQACVDTWTFKAGTWTKLSPTVSPPARYVASMAYDAADGYVVLFGGAGASGFSMNDTWTFKAGAWTKLSPSTAPPASTNDMMAYDAADGYLLLSGECFPECITWTFKAGTWTQLFPAVTPQHRNSGYMAYDAADGYVLLFAGCDGGCHDDTWTFKAGIWTQLFPANHPPVEASGSMAYDAADGYIVLFGGSGYAKGITWEFKAGDWTTQLSKSVYPLQRQGASIAYDSADGYILLFGGYDGMPLNDTWTFKAGTWTRLSTSTSPSPRYDASMAYDAADGYVVLFGGYNGTGLGDTWKFASGIWTQLHPSAPPSSRLAGSMTYDAADGYVLLFGGANGGSVFGDTWTFKAGTWTQLSPTTSPPVRYFASMAYDTADGYVLLFGGYSGSGVGDTWTFKAGTWTQLSPSGSPSPRYYSSMAYDAADGYILLFGGYDGNYEGDTWQYKANTWAQLTVSRAPSPRIVPAMSYDELDGHILLFGGQETYNIVGDTWKFIATTTHATTTTVSCDTPVVFYQNSTCTATVSDHSASPIAPTGIVNLFIGPGAPLDRCTLTTLNPTSASCSGKLDTSPGKVSGGPNTITAAYAGDITHLTSRSAGFTVTVNPRSITVGLTCAPPSVNLGQITTCTATVTDTSPGTPHVSGMGVAFSTNGTGTFSSNSLCNLSATGAAGTCAVTYTPAAGIGVHRITAVSGGFPYSNGQGSFDLTVLSGLHPSATTVSCNTPVAVNEASTCKVTVADTSPSGATTPTGTVVLSAAATGATGTFTACTLAVGTTTGTATCTSTFTPSSAGTATITGVYAGDTASPGHSSSTSPTTTVTVNLRSTNTSISCNPPTVVVGDTISCIVTVLDVSGGTSSAPAGTITITPTGTCSLAGSSPAGAMCTATITPTAVGTDTFSASYPGDSTHAASVDQSHASVQVTLRHVSLTVNCVSSTIVVGESSTCTATVADSSPGPTSSPTGTVTFTTNSTGTFSSTTCTLVSGSCGVNYAPTVAGHHGIIGAYGGDSVHSANTSGAFTVTVTPPTAAPDFTLTANPTSLTLSPENSENCQGAQASMVCDDEGTVTITVTPQNGFTGDVALSISSTPQLEAHMSKTLINTSGTATLKISDASPGSYTITVTATSGTSQSLTHSVTITVTVRPGQNLNCGGEDKKCEIESDAPLENTNFSGHTIHFTMRGDAGTTGAANVTIAKSAVPDINRIKILVDRKELSKSDISMTSDDNNYHVYFKVTFHSNVDVEIDLNPAATILGFEPTVFYSLTGGIAVVVAAVGALAYRASRKKPKA